MSGESTLNERYVDLIAVEGLRPLVECYDPAVQGLTRAVNDECGPGMRKSVSRLTRLWNISGRKRKLHIEEPKRAVTRRTDATEVNPSKSPCPLILTRPNYWDRRKTLRSTGFVEDKADLWSFGNIHCCGFKRCSWSFLLYLIPQIALALSLGRDRLESYEVLRAFFSPSSTKKNEIYVNVTKYQVFFWFERLNQFLKKGSNPLSLRFQAYLWRRNKSNP